MRMMECLVICVVVYAFTPVAWGQEVIVVPGARAPAAGGLRETFETQPLQGWELIGGAQIATDRTGQALSLTGPGYGFWAVAQVGDFTLKFRYRHAQATADIVLRGSGEPPQNQEYHVRLGAGEIHIARLAGGQETSLYTSRANVAPGWHNVVITASGGQLQVSIDGNVVANATDPQPLPQGVLGFGCGQGSGLAYDDITVSVAGGGEPLAAMPITLPGPVAAASPTPLPGGPTVAAPVEGGSAGPDMTAARQAMGKLTPQTSARVAQPPTRAMALSSLLADPETAGELRAIPSLGGMQPEQLMTVGMDGMPVSGNVMTAAIQPGGRADPRSTPTGTPIPAGAATSASDFNWKAGVEFSPTKPPLHYYGPTMYYLGIMEAYGAFVDQRWASLAQMQKNNCLYLLWDWSVSLYVELPGPGTYMVSFKTVGPDGKSLAPYAKGAKATLRARVGPGKSGWGTPAPIDIKLSALSDGSGLVGLVTPTWLTTPGQVMKSGSGHGMRGISAVIQIWADSYPGCVFGGITVTRL